MAVRSDQLAREPWCRRCGRAATEVDHVTRIVDGGSDAPGNLQSLCRSCHAAKTAAGR